MRVAAVLGGVVLGLGAFFLAVIYLFIISWGCEGTDAGDPPPAGSAAATLCDSPALPWMMLVLGLAALVAPIVGAVLAARPRRYAPLLASAAVAAGAVCALGLLLHAVEQGSESVELFVGAPLLALLGLAALAIRQNRAERPH